MELRGERDNARNNARCTQARKTTPSLTRGTSSITSTYSPLSSSIPPSLFHSTIITIFCKFFPPQPSFSSSGLIQRTVYTTQTPQRTPRYFSHADTALHFKMQCGAVGVGVVRQVFGQRLALVRHCTTTHPTPHTSKRTKVMTDFRQNLLKRLDCRPVIVRLGLKQLTHEPHNDDDSQTGLQATDRQVTQ